VVGPGGLEEVLDMGGRVANAAANAVAALTKGDQTLAKSLIIQDAAIDSMQREVETKAIETIARRQPFAVDLRELASAFHIVNDLERIGDLAKNIGKRAPVMEAAPPAELLRRIGRVSVRVLRPLTLYEFDFEGTHSGSYEPSLSLPVRESSSEAELKTYGT
jgi:phosphate transport system protein